MAMAGTMTSVLASQEPDISRNRHPLVCGLPGRKLTILQRDHESLNDVLLLRPCGGTEVAPDHGRARRGTDAPPVRPFPSMLAAIASATLGGAVGRAVSVEVHVSNGLPGFTIVGLPDASVREARDRVRAALLSSGFTWPLRRTVVNLAPSGIRKGGAGLDLPIAVGLLVATGELDVGCTQGLAFCGELGLNGSLRHVPGMIALADATVPLGLVVPLCDVREAALVRGGHVHGAVALGELTRVLRGQAPVSYTHLTLPTNREV